MKAPELVVGTTAAAKDYGPLTTRMFVRYSGASGDFNPMHYDDALARSAGYPGVFSQGMHVAALLAGYAVEWLGAANVRHFGVRFRDQVYPGDILTCTGTIAGVERQADGTLVTVELRAGVGESKVALTATADFLLPA